MTSEATVMSKRVLRGTPSPSRPISMLRSARSLRSTTRGQSDGLGVDVEVVAVEEVVVQHGRAQVVGGGDGVKVAGEVEVDVLHRHDLGVAATGRATLDAEGRAQGGLAQRGDDALADLGQAHGETDVDRGLAFARRGGGDGRTQDQLAVGTIGQAIQDVQVDLGLVLAVEIDVVLGQAQPRRDLDDRLEGSLLSNLDVALVRRAQTSPLLQSMERSAHYSDGWL